MLFAPFYISYSDIIVRFCSMLLLRTKAMETSFSYHSDFSGVF